MSSRLSRDCLSAHDQEVLDSVFNPLQIGGDVPNGAFNAEIRDDLQDEKEDQTDATKCEIEGVQLAEKELYVEALDKFKQSIESNPTRPSVYNNRAQVYRLQGNDAVAFEDLDKSIGLCTEKYLRTKCQALCQRGVLYRKLQKLDEARADFEGAATLGSKFARTQVYFLRLKRCFFF
ncbi:TTC36 family protein [Megaselia abdita]